MAQMTRQTPLTIVDLCFHRSLMSEDKRMSSWDAVVEEVVDVWSCDLFNAKARQQLPTFISLASGSLFVIPKNCRNVPELRTCMNMDLSLQHQRCSQTDAPRSCSVDQSFAHQYLSPSTRCWAKERARKIAHEAYNILEIPQHQRPRRRAILKPREPLPDDFVFPGEPRGRFAILTPLVPLPDFFFPNDDRNPTNTAASGVRSIFSLPIHSSRPTPTTAQRSLSTVARTRLPRKVHSA